MKKIVSIVAVAAVLASSVFAADVSAKVKLDGSLFNLGDKAALKIGHNTDEAWNPVLAMSVNGDNAGAEVSFYSGSWTGNLGNGVKDLEKKELGAGFMGGWNNAYVLGAKTYKIWAQPIDMLKFEFGNISTNLNQEQIDWSSTDSGCDSEGYGLDLFFGAASVNVYLLPGFDNYWLKDGAVAETYFKFQYGADFGTINVMFDGKDTFKDDKFGIGYNGNFGGVNAFINVLGYVNNGFNKVRAEIFAKGAAGSFGWNIWLPFDFTIADSKAALGTTLKLTMPVASVNAYLYVKEADWLSFSSINVKPGVTGNVGAMSWEIAADMNIGGDFSLNVPVSFTVGF